MSQKKNGFTLIEVLVVMLITTLVLTTVGGTMVFVTTTTGDLIKQAEEIEMAKNIEKYLRTQKDKFTFDENGSNNFLLDNGELKYNNNVIFSDTSLDEFRIYIEKEKENENDFIKCSMVFKSGRKFDFILGVSIQEVNE